MKPAGFRIDGKSRLVIIGNSGSGKSTLAEHVGGSAKLPIHDLDMTHWLDQGGKRDEAGAKALVAEIASTDAWIVEGVYGWLADVALPRATALVWTDLPWCECLDGLLGRGLRRGMSDEDQKALLSWAGDYWTRTTPSSFVGHERIFRVFDREKLRLTTRQAVSDLMAKPSDDHVVHVG